MPLTLCLMLVLWQMVKTQMKHSISLGSANFAEIETIFRDRNISEFGNSNHRGQSSVYSMPQSNKFKSSL